MTTPDKPADRPMSPDHSFINPREEARRAARDKPADKHGGAVTSEERTELARLCEAATAGPLSTEGFTDYVFLVPRGNIPIFESRGTGANLPQEANRRYLVALWNLAPRLLADLHRVETERDEAEGRVERAEKRRELWQESAVKGGKRAAAAESRASTAEAERDHADADLANERAGRAKVEADWNAERERAEKAVAELGEVRARLAEAEKDAESWRERANRLDAILGGCTYVEDNERDIAIYRTNRTQAWSGAYGKRNVIVGTLTWSAAWAAAVSASEGAGEGK